MLDAAAAPTPEPATPSAADPASTPAAPAPAPAAPRSTVSLLYDDEDPAPAPAPAPAAGDKDPAPAPAEGEQPAAGEAAAGTIGTVAELIEQYQLDPDAFKSLKIDVKVDRETTQVPIAELVKSYQISEAATKRLDEAKAVTQALAADRNTLHAQLTGVANLIKVVEDELDRDAKAINWDELRAKDPAEWTAKKTEIKDRRDRLAALKDEGKQAWNAAVQAQQSTTVVGLAERVAAEREKLLAALPEWKDPKVAKAEKKALVEYLTQPGQGFTSEEIASTYDHRLLVIAHKARKHDEDQAKAAAALKIIPVVPKVLSSGGGGSPPAPPKKVSHVDALYPAT